MRWSAQMQIWIMSVFYIDPGVSRTYGLCYLSGDLKEHLKRKDIEHIRGALYHPMTQVKMESYHRLMKNVIKLRNYEFPLEL